MEALLALIIFCVLASFVLEKLGDLIGWVTDVVRETREGSRFRYRGDFDGLYVPPLPGPSPPSPLEELRWDEKEPEENPRPARYRKWPGR